MLFILFILVVRPIQAMFVIGWLWFTFLKFSFNSIEVVNKCPANVQILDQEYFLLLLRGGSLKDGDHETHMFWAD
jgi:uncharacterized membrane protein YobD (UPF0266 family)